MADEQIVEDGIIEEVVEALEPETVVDETQKDLEERARRQGWKPQSEYRGPAGRWRDAKAFLEHGENEWPILRERLRKIDERAAEREAKLTAELEDTKKKLTETSEVMVEMRDLQLKAEERAYARAKRDIETTMQRAVETSDLPTYHAARQELDAVEATRPPPVRASAPVPPAPVTTPPPAGGPTPTIEPAISDWIGQNPWFERDNVLKAFAMDVDGELMRRFPGMGTSDRLEEVTRRTMAKFPEKFGTPARRSSAAPVLGGSPPPPRKTGKSYDDLPADAKAACDRCVSSIPGYKREDYVKIYFQGEA